MRVLSIVVLLAFTGCATIMAGGPDRFPITTNPPGATVFVDNVPVGQTPTMVTLDRERSGGVVRIEMPGFAPIAIIRTRNINGWFWANFCFGGLIGFVIDLATGNYKAFDDGPIAVSLTPAYGVDPGGAAPPAGYLPPPAAPPGYPPPAAPPGGYAPPPPPR
jgi:PEGA domain